MDQQDISVLEAVLGGRAFVCGGTEACQADGQLYAGLLDRLPDRPACVVRWAQHMAALTPHKLHQLTQHNNCDSKDKKVESQLSNLLQKVRLNQQEQCSRRFTAVTTTPPPAAASTSSTDAGGKGKASKGGKLILKTAKGTRDFHPAEMAVRRTVFDKIKSVFHLHGAVEIETPVFELKEVLTDKYGEDSKLIYDLEDQGGEILSLRYDLTVPFARYVAQNKIDNISRYHIARVYRRDQPAILRGRYREFYQCDFDIAGAYDLMIPDAECVQVIDQVLGGLDLGGYTIKVNHRKVLDGLFGACGVPPEKFRSICSAVDKLDKTPWCEVRQEMVLEKGLDESVADIIGEYVKMSGKQDLLDKLMTDDRLKNNQDVQTGIKELELLLQYTSLLECDSNLVLDMGLARGLDYYTGIIYEAVLLEGQELAPVEAKEKSKGKKKKEDSTEDDGGSVGSVAGGGRYDNLVGMFDSKKRTVPCVGVSFGIERLFAIQERKMRLQDGKLRSSMTNVYVVGVCKGMLHHRLALCALLHKANINAETSRKTNPKFLTQLQYAEDTGIPLMVTIGDSEVADGVVNVRNTILRQETKVVKGELVQHLHQLLKQF